MKSDLEKLKKDLEEKSQTLKSWQSFLKLLSEKGKKTLKRGEKPPEGELLYRGWELLVKESIYPHWEKLSGSLGKIESSLKTSNRLALILISLLTGLQLITLSLLLFRTENSHLSLNCTVQTGEAGKKWKVCKLPEGTLAKANGRWMSCQAIAIPLKD